MRVVVDTNVIVSGFLSLKSPPGRLLLAAALGRIRLCAPHTVGLELDRVLRRKPGYGPDEVDSAVESLPIEWIEEAVYRGSLTEATRLVRDADDAPVLALALAIRCDIVSGDKDLQAVQRVGLRVWKPAELAQRR